MISNKDFEVIIIGGSYAGLSSALALGRSLRHVLIIDNALPCNRQTPHSHNFLTQDGKTPKAIATLARQEVLQYETVQFHQALATTGVKTAHGFEITTDNMDKFTAKKLIFASGIKDSMLEIKGFAACWGISVVHRPYCHGYEIRNKNTAIIANGARALHLASLINNLSTDLTLLTNGKPDFTAEQVEKLTKHNIKIIDTTISEVVHVDGNIQHIVFSDMTKKNFEAAYASLPFVQHSSMPEAFGCVLTDQGHLQIDAFHKTNIPGIYACGDNSNMMRSVANAVYSGNLVGAAVNAELVQEQF